MKWTVYGRRRSEAVSRLHATETLEYRAEIEVYKGQCHRMVCEWSVWFPNYAQDYGICYGLVEAKQQVERAIAARRFVEEAKRENNGI